MGKSFTESLFDVSGRVVLVTGGRRGLGRAMSLGLVKAGARVAAVSASADDAGLASEAKAVGGELVYFPTDLRTRAARQRLIPDVVERFGCLDGLVNCAGATHRAPAIEFPLDQWDELISLMLTAVFELCQQAGRIMAGQGGGKIVNVASLLSFQGGWTIPAYTAAKHGVLGLTRALSNEWASKNINVNSIAPGYFKTDLCEGILNDPVREPKIRERIPAGRWGEPDDLVGPALFLLSDASRYVHGEVIIVDGGWMGR